MNCELKLWKKILYTVIVTLMLCGWLITWAVCCVLHIPERLTLILTYGAYAIPWIWLVYCLYSQDEVEVDDEDWGDC